VRCGAIGDGGKCGVEPFELWDGFFKKRSFAFLGFRREKLQGKGNLIGFQQIRYAHGTYSLAFLFAHFRQM
jgi:hypothetical protein